MPRKVTIPIDLEDVDTATVTKAVGKGPVRCLRSCRDPSPTTNKVGRMSGDVPLSAESSTWLDLELVGAVITAAAAHLSSRIRRW